jgi:hypothetical protein
MAQLVLVVREPWHHKPLGRRVVRGELITDPVEVQQILVDRPNYVTKRMSVPHEDADIAAKVAALAPKPALVAPAPAPVPVAPKSAA